MEAEIQNRMSPLTTDVTDEILDPRIQGELEKLNKASDDINKLELELDDERAAFRQALSDTTHKLNALAKKLGHCVEKARPYYEQRHKVLEAHTETQKVAIRFERACSMHEAAKEMVQLAEQGYMRGEASTDPAWQEMLNHATMKVNDAERERNESEAEHRKAMLNFQKSDEKCHHLQKDLKRMISKSRPYFELKAAVNQQMEDNKRVIKCLEEDVQSAKFRYAEALRNLEKISDSIHQQRMQKREQMELGVRGAGVGSETPSPPPNRLKDNSSMDGQYVVVTCAEENPPKHFFTQANESLNSSIQSNNLTPRCMAETFTTDVNESEYAVSNLETDVTSSSGIYGYNTSIKDRDYTSNRHSLSKVRNSLTDSGLPSHHNASSVRPRKLNQGELILCVNKIMDPLAQTYHAERIQPTRKHRLSKKEQSEMRNSGDNKPALSTESPMTSESLTVSAHSSLGSALDDDRSDVESIASTGTMLDDDQVEYLTIEFSDMFNSSEDLSKREEPHHQMALPPKLSFLENYVHHANTSTQQETKDNEEACFSQQESKDHIEKEEILLTQKETEDDVDNEKTESTKE